jgi:flagellar hook-basal body complex protein FliE
MSEIKQIGQGMSQAFKPAQKSSQPGEFDALLNDTIGKVASVQREAEEAVKSLSSGGDVSQAMIAMEKADISFELMLEVRNKLVSAYEEIMRMQV